jgi:hypothetical protein
MSLIDGAKVSRPATAVNTTFAVYPLTPPYFPACNLLPQSPAGTGDVLMGRLCVPAGAVFGILTGSSGMITGSSGMITGSSGILTESFGILTGSSGILTESSGMITESSGMITESSGILTESSGMITGSSGMLTGSSGILTGSSDILAESSGMITGSSGILTGSSGSHTQISPRSAQAVFCVACIRKSSRFAPACKAGKPLHGAAPPLPRLSNKNNRY